MSTTTFDPTQYMTLAELNAALPVQVSAAQLRALGFVALAGSTVCKQVTDPEMHRRYRSASLYRREDLPRIRAGIAASMLCADGEAYLAGDLITQAQQALPPGYAMRIEVSPAGIRLHALYPDVTVPMPLHAERPLSSCIKALIQCACADAAAREIHQEK